MFGTKLRTWMEAHIVRSKKKKDRKKGDKGFDSNCNSPRNRSANRSPCLHQVHPAESPEKTVDGIRLHGGGSYATASASSGTSAGTGSVNLSSPESAYSTGYSTDGTSPGASFPPEYYINIRTGTHYFQSNGNNVRPKKSAGAGELPAGCTLGSSTGSGSGSGSGLGLGPGPVPVPGPGTGPGAALLAGHGILEAAACLASMTKNDNRSRDGRGTNAPNKVSYVNGNIVGRRIASSGSAYMTAFASEIALIEADKEADKKCRELILEAENILVTMQKSQNGGLQLPVVPSPSRKFHNGLANKRVELIKNTELNIELALSKSRNSQPELQSGSIRDLEHTSPKRQFTQPCSPIRRFVERNGPATNELRGSFRQETPLKYFAGDSPIAARRTPPLHSPGKPLFRSVRRESDPEPVPNLDRRPELESEAERHSQMEDNETLGPPSLDCNGVRRISSNSEPTTIHADVRSQNRPRPAFPCARRNEADGTDSHATKLPAKEEFILSSSSDSEERCDVRRRPTLMTFRSVDMGPTKEGSFYCPQSEPVKRKVYAGSTTYGRIQKTLGEHVALRNSDGDTATDDTDDSRRSLKEKVAQLRRERLVTVDAHDSHILQQQMSQLRKQMLMHTIEGLKRSLEDQSATLKQTCLEPVLSDQLP